MFISFLSLFLLHFFSLLRNGNKEETENHTIFWVPLHTDMCHVREKQAHVWGSCTIYECLNVYTVSECLLRLYSNISNMGFSGNADNASNTGMVSNVNKFGNIGNISNARKFSNIVSVKLIMLVMQIISVILVSQ